MTFEIQHVRPRGRARKVMMILPRETYRDTSPQLLTVRSDAPRLIAICGAPEVGKSTVQNIIQERIGAIPCDDGRALRNAAKELFGFTEHDVTTQEGKASNFVMEIGQLDVRRRLPGVMEALYRMNRHVARDGMNGLKTPSDHEICGRVWKFDELADALERALMKMIVNYQCRMASGEILKVRHPLGDIGNIVEDMHGPDFIPESAIAAAMDRCEDDAICTFGSVRRGQGWVYLRHGGIVIEIVRPGKKVVNAFDAYDAAAVQIVIENDGDLAKLNAEIEAKIMPLYTLEPALEAEPYCYQEPVP